MLKNYKFFLAAQVLVLAASAPIFAMDSKEAEQADGRPVEFLGVADGSDSDEAQEVAADSIPAEGFFGSGIQQPTGQDSAQQKEKGEPCRSCGKFHGQASARAAKAVPFGHINGIPVAIEFPSDSEDSDTQAKADPELVAFWADMQKAAALKKATRAAAQAAAEADLAELMALKALKHAKIHREEANQAAARVKALRAAQSDGGEALEAAFFDLFRDVSVKQGDDGLSPEERAQQLRESGCGMQ